MKHLFVTMLLRLYPKRWRSEYGPELSGVLLSRPLGVRVILNVLGSALWQQGRDGEPWILLGTPLLALSLLNCAAILAGAPRQQPNSARAALISVLIFLTVGFWTMARRGSGAGRAAMKFSLLVTSPLIATGVLAVTGVVRLAPAATAPNSAATFLLWFPLSQIPFVALIGWIGGLAARGYRRLISPAR